LFHATTPSGLVTASEGEVGPTATLQIFPDVFRIDEIITTMIPGP
jgi:hypothetical protein